MILVDTSIWIDHLRQGDHQRLFGFGMGYVDAHLLASTRMSGGARLWTRDKRLHATAVQLDLHHRGAQDR